MNNIKQQKICFTMMLLQFACAGVLYFFYTKYNSIQPVDFLMQIANVLLIGGVLSLLAWRHSILAWNAFIEKRDNAENPVEDNIFNNEVDMSGRQERAFLQFNKVFLPVMLIVLSALEFFLSGRVLFLDVEIEKIQGNLLVPAAVLTGLSIILFLAGKFMSGLAYDEKLHFLRPVCGYLLLNSFTMFLGLIATLSYHFGAAGALDIFLWASVILSMLLAVERILLWIVDMYRPKGKDEDYIPVYESRILALFSQPRGVLGNLAAMLEYQFGIKVSESSFSLFFKRILIPFICIQILSLFILSTITYIKPNEKGLKFSWGQSEFKVLDSGLHFTAPWPMCKVERYDFGRVKEVDLTKNDKFKEEFKIADADTWDNEAYKNLVSMAAVKSNEANDQNLVVANVKLKYTVTDVMKFRGSYVDTEEALKMYGQQALSRALLENDFNTVLKSGLKEFTAGLKRKLQNETKALGVDIVDIEFINFQPPPEVAEAYQDTMDARQESIKQMIEAEKYSVKLLSLADVTSDKEVKTAQSETILKSKLLDARLKSFESQLAAYKKLPLVYETQAKMIAFENWIKNVRKVVNLTGASREIITLEMKKNSLNLFDTELDNEK